MPTLGVILFGDTGSGPGSMFPAMGAAGDRMSGKSVTLVRLINGTNESVRVPENGVVKTMRQEGVRV